jgi:tol-pal system protein YbgF
MKRIRLFALTAALLVSASVFPLHAHAQYQDDSESDTEARSGGNASAAARLQVRINELEEQVRKLQGAMEQTSFSNRQLKTQMEKMRGDIDYRLTALEKNPATTANAPTPAPAPEAAVEDALEPNKYIAGKKPAAAEAQPTSVQNFATSHEHYSAAFKLLNQAKYAEASDVFSAFTTRYPKDPLIGNAFYWLGETYYVRKDYVKAADTFRQGYEAMPTGPKAADNLLKLAMALSAQGQDKNSCVVLKQVSAKFGKASGSLKARVEQEMNRIDCR